MIFKFVFNSAFENSYLLPSDPIGWDEIELGITRGIEYSGFFYEQTADLKFVCGAGREYIENIYDTYGVEGKVTIDIFMSCDCQEFDSSNSYSNDYSYDYGSPVIGGCVFDNIYSGELDLMTLQFTDEFLTCQIKNDNFFTKVRNRLETKVNLNDSNSVDDVAIDVISPYTMTLHSKTIKFYSKWANCLDLDINDNSNPAGDSIQFIIPAVPTISDSGQEYDTCSQNYRLTNSGAYDQDSLKDYFMYHNVSNGQNVDVRVKAKGRFVFTVNNRDTTSPNLVFAINLAWGQELNFAGGYFTFSTLFNEATGIGAPYTRTIPFDIDVTTLASLGNDKKLYLYGTVNNFLNDVSTPSFSLDFILDELLVELEYLSTINPSESSVYAIHEAGHQVTRNITGVNDCFYSELLGLKNFSSVTYNSNGEGGFNAVTSGNLIRGKDKPLNTSLKELFSSVNAIYNAGLGIEKIDNDWVVRIERKEHFFDSTTTLLTFDWVANIKKTVAKEFIYNNIEVGFTDWEIEQVNGLDEFNTSRQFNTRNDKSVNNLFAKSEYIASGYAIEFTRRQSISNDWKYDNKNFIIALNRSVSVGGGPLSMTIAEKDENYSSVGNLLDPSSVYNLRLSPTRNITRWMNVIGSVVYKFANRLIKYTYGEGNIDLQATETTNTIGDYSNQLLSEKQDIQWDGFAYIEPIWIPEYYEFDFPLSYNEFNILKNNSKGVIQFSSTDSDYIKGYIIDIRYKPVLGLASFKLLKAWQ